MSAQSKQMRLMDEIGKELSRKGFQAVDSRRLVKYMETKGCEKEGRPILAGERIFNCGLDGKRSNVFVFTQLDPINETVRVLMASPRADKQACDMKENELAIREEYHDVNESDINKIAKEISNKCAREAMHKDAKQFRMQCHVHTKKSFDNSEFFDDGVSNITDVIRRAMLYNSDYLVLTTHNSLDLNKFAMIEAVCRMMGITAVMGIELTAPLLHKRVNGPHLLLFIGNRDAAIEVGNRILSKREPGLNMQSYFRSIDGDLFLNDMLRELDDLRKSGQVALGAAHPFNYNSSVLPIKSVGLLSAVDEGMLSLQTAISLAKTMDFFEAWNRSISPDKMKFNNSELYNWISGLVATRVLDNPLINGAQEVKGNFKLSDIMSANICNLAMGIWLQEQVKMQCTFGTDDHCTPPLDWRYLRGGYFEAGFTYFNSENKISAEEVVRRITDRSLGLSAHIHSAATSKGLQVAEVRTKVPDDLKGTWDKLKAKHLFDYIKVLTSDAFGFLGKGEPGMIGKMDK